MLTEEENEKRCACALCLCNRMTRAFYTICLHCQNMIHCQEQPNSPVNLRVIVEKLDEPLRDEGLLAGLTAILSKNLIETHYHLLFAKVETIRAIFLNEECGIQKLDRVGKARVLLRENFRRLRGDYLSFYARYEMTLEAVAQRRGFADVAELQELSNRAQRKLVDEIYFRWLLEDRSKAGLLELLSALDVKSDLVC